MMATAVQLSQSLQPMIDCRLDTIDRMLIGRVPRQDRLAIVREVESQIQELLQERCAEEPTREDVLAVLAQLDPPEAYLPDEDGVPAPRTRVFRPDRRSEVERVTAPAARSAPSAGGRASGIIGIISLALIALYPLGYVAGLALSSENVILFAWGLAAFLMFGGGVLALVLGVRARKSGAWALTGAITGVSALVAVMLAVCLFVAMLL
jgi:hypothetical protein